MLSRLTPLVLLGLLALGGLLAPAQAAQVSAVAAPVLKWQYGGCNAPPHYCDTGWYASPAVADLDGDNKPEVIWASYDLFTLNGENGTVQWTAPSGARAWPGIAVADLTGDGSLEVIVGRNSDQVTVYNSAGGQVWTRNPFGNGEVRTLAVEDLEQDGQLEVVVGRGSGGDTRQVNVYEPNGSVRPGWPARHVGEPGYGWGMYNENVTVADMNGDGLKEIFAPTDTHYITALDRNGNQLAVNPIYSPRAVWSQVGVHVDQAADLRGYAECGTEHRPNFANAAPSIADMDGNGSLELVVPGDVYNCDIGDPDGDMYYLPWILKLDRTRWSGSGFDWTVLPAPAPNSGALTQDYDVIENAVVNAVLADLDGDGRKEIIYASYDGRVHAYWLDKTQHGNWPFDVPCSGIRFASEPVVADLDNDGKAEVIFTSWPEKHDGLVGQLHILDYQGNQIQVVNLPAPGEGADWNGSLGAPTIANIDADADLELVMGTSHSGVVAYDLPGSANARVLWGTGRGSQKRAGAAPPAPPTLSISSPQPAKAIKPGASASYILDVTGSVKGAVTLTAGQVVGPAPLPTISLSTTSLTTPGKATLTLTDHHTGATLMPGVAYRVQVTATSGQNSQKLMLYLLVGGVKGYLPIVRR
jgi:hypothetical protein